MTDEGRLPKNLQGLLQFAMLHTRSEDAPRESNFEKMDPERRKFLEEALNSMTVNVIEEFEKALGILDDSTSEPGDMVMAMKTIEDYVDNIDFANNLVKIGGSRVVIGCLNSDSSEVRAAAASLIAAMCQNNEYCQQHFLDENLLPKLVELLNDVEVVASKSMHAISCSVRSYEPAMTALVEIGGLECIIGCLGSGEEKIFVKACFLIAALAAEFEHIRDQFIKLGLIERLSEYLEVPKEYSARMETLLSALTILTDSGDNAPYRLSTKLKDKLQQIIKATAGEPEFEEIIDYSKIVLARCSAESSEDTDR